MLKNHPRLDSKLDRDIIKEKDLVANVTEMVKANMSFISFPESQTLIDAELLKEQSNEQRHTPPIESVDGSISQQLLGTLYNRISHKPSLFHDKVERNKYFADSKWLSISHHKGCWVTNASKIMNRASKKVQGANDPLMEDKGEFQISKFR